MSEAKLVTTRNSHINKIISDLIEFGWSIDSIPKDGKIPKNGIKLILKTNSEEVKFRIFGYKVTTSGRNKSHERRIEITNTYHSGIGRLRGFRDVVLGIDVGTGKYVGVDSRRLKIGGTTHNASSFFDLEGLSVKPGELLINPRPVSAPVFSGGIEYHSFFDPSRLSEYLLNQPEIHLGRYSFQGAFSGRLRKKHITWPNNNIYPAQGEAIILSFSAATPRAISHIPKDLIASVEQNDYSNLQKRKITPAMLKEIHSICDEVGSIGEQLVLSAERKRLSKLGFKKQASKVERVSLWSVGEGYDILSFEDDGITRRYLEVKTTVGKGALVDVSITEWKAAQKHKDKYYLVRVIDVKKSPQIFFIQNPCDLEKQGRVSKTASGWKVDLQREIKPQKGK